MEKYKGIGVLDSGVGGLTVASAISGILPNEKIFYFGDTANCPYGDKTEEHIQSCVLNVINFLVSRGIKALVMACNTSSALVLPKLNGEVKVPVLGVIEFASRMALEASKSERIGVVANPLTVRSGAYIDTILKISQNGTKVFQNPCPRWVPLIEEGRVTGEDVERVVGEDLLPLTSEQIDTLILGCTHYPYMIPSIKRVLNNGINIIDPAEALALKLKDLLTESNNLSDLTEPEHEFYVSGDPVNFHRTGSRFFGKELPLVKKVSL